MAQVVLEHLIKLFAGPGGERIRAVDDASLTIQDKELLVLVGPSGCGKTTTLRLIAGLEDPTEGTISIGGKIVNRLAPKDRDVAMVFQHFALYPHMTVYENLAFGLRLRHVSRAETEQRVRETAGTLQLGDCLDRRPAELSGGQRQRVALGRALVRHPSLLLLDEPLSNLDAATRLQMRAEIARLHAHLGSTMLYVTHDQVEALTLGHRVAVMKDGRILQVDAPMSLYAHPANLFVAGFIGSPPMNLFDGTLVERGKDLVFEESPRSDAAAARSLSLGLNPSHAPSLRGCIGKPVVIGIRPEHITCSPPQPASSPENALQAVVELVQPMGAETYLHLTGHARPIVARVSATQSAAVNEAFSLGFDLAHCHFFDPASGAALLKPQAAA